VPDTLATLYVGLDLGLAYAVEMDALTAAEAQTWRARGWEALKHGASDQARRVERQRPSELFLNTLGDLLALGRVHLEAADGDGRIGGGSVPDESIGWYDETHVHLLTPAYNHVARFLHDEGARLPVKQRTLRKQLLEEGYLERGSDNHYTVRFWDGERHQRVLRLRRRAVARHVDLLADDGEDQACDEIAF
jgi:hypothetical protein